MTEPIDNNPWIAKNYLLVRLLLLSTALNLGLLSTFVCQRLQKSRATKKGKHPNVIALEETNVSIVDNMLQMTKNELLEQLTNTQLLQDGYSCREFALSILSEYFHYDIARALGEETYQTRAMVLHRKNAPEAVHLHMYPHLDVTEWAQVYLFVEQEQWPLTPYGLYLELQKAPMNQSLQQAFAVTSPFCRAKTYLSRIKESISNEEVMEVFLGGDWNTFVRLDRDEGINKVLIRDVLLQYAKNANSTACRLWIEGESDILLRRTSDEELLAIIYPLKELNTDVVHFLQQVLAGPRINDVRKIAGLKLYELFGDTAPDPYDDEVASYRFLKEVCPEVKKVEKKTTSTAHNYGSRGR